MNNFTKVQKQKKTNKMNAYWAFFLEFQRKMHCKYSSEQQLQEEAGKVWKGMTQQEKDRYKESAKLVEPFENKKYKRLNNQQRPINEVEAEKADETRRLQSVKDDIKEMISKAEMNEELDRLVFYFISTSSFCSNSKDVYPAELAIAKFSLRNGVFEDIQIRINPGELPLGSGYEAREMSEKKLKYPLPKQSSTSGDGERDYINILLTMIKFLHPLEELPIFFTEGDTSTDLPTIRNTCRVVKKILHNAQEYDLERDLKIYPVSELFFQLQRATVARKNMLNETKETKFPSISSATNTFHSENFIHLTNGCDFHVNNDASVHCCLTKVRCFGYIISKWCSNGKVYPLEAGKHFPARLTVKQED